MLKKHKFIFVVVAALLGIDANTISDRVRAYIVEHEKVEPFVYQVNLEVDYPKYASKETVNRVLGNHADDIVRMISHHLDPAIVQLSKDVEQKKGCPCVSAYAWNPLEPNTIDDVTCLNTSVVGRDSFYHKQGRGLGPDLMKCDTKGRGGWYVMTLHLGVDDQAIRLIRVRGPHRYADPRRWAHL